MAIAQGRGDCLMKIKFFASDKPREQELGAAFLRGALRAGHDIDLVSRSNPDFSNCDAAGMVGVKSAELFRAARAAGVVPIYFDKGYIRSRAPSSRTWEYWRISLGAHHPTRTSLMAKKMPADRFESLGIGFEKWKRRRKYILIAGSSAKYHRFYNLPDPTTYAKALVQSIKEISDRPIIYRPKPSWRDAEPIKGTEFAIDHGIRADLERAHCLVTHGSNACFEAALLGVPSIILGDAIARPISSTSLSEIEILKHAKRRQWAYNLAYHQWTLEEMSSGLAWATIKDWF